MRKKDDKELLDRKNNDRAEKDKKSEYSNANLPIPSDENPISRITRAVSSIKEFGIQAFEGIKGLFRFTKL